MITKKSKLLFQIVVVFLITLNLSADVKQEMLDLYKSKQYEKVCSKGFKTFKDYRKDESFVSLYAFSCLYSDYIDRLSIPIAILKFSKESRANSAYLAVILMQKKLLYHSLVDGYNLTSLNLPTTDYILSKVFDLYAKLGDHKPRELYFFEDPDNDKITYTLSLSKDKKLSKMIVEEFYNSRSIKRHIYW